MQQLVIKLSPEATAKYLRQVYRKNIAEMENDMEASGHSLDIRLDLIPGITLADININGKTITQPSDDNAVEVELITPTQ